MDKNLSELLSDKTLQVWNDLVSEVDSLYLKLGMRLLWQT